MKRPNAFFGSINFNLQSHLGNKTLCDLCNSKSQRKRRKESVSPTESGTPSETTERDKSKESERSTSEGTYLCVLVVNTPCSSVKYSL